MIMRTIVEAQVVSKKIDHAISKFPRMNDVYIGIQWRLSREPQNGFLLKNNNTSIYLYKISPAIFDYPPVTLIYTYNDTTVDIIDIRFV